MAWLDGVGVRGCWVVMACVGVCGCNDAPASSEEAGETESTAQTSGQSTGLDPDVSPPDASSSSGEVVREDPFEGAHIVRAGAASGARTFGDFDGDGDDDIVIAYETDLLMERVLGVYGYDPQEDTFEFIMQPKYPFYVAQMVPGYADGNARLDIIAVNTDAAEATYVQLAFNSDNEVEYSDPFRQVGVRVAAPADFDDDRRSEIVHFFEGQLRVLEVDRAGGWQLVGDVAFPSDCTPSSGAGKWGDVDGDGSPELVTIAPCDDGTGQLIVYEQDDAGMLVKLAGNPLDLPADTVTLADFDDDGVLDALISTTNYDPEGDPPQGRVLAGTGDGLFASVLLDVPPSDLGFGVIGALTADIDGDGVPEAFPSNWDDEALGANGTDQYMITLGDPIRFDYIPFEDYFATAADINGDGCEDLLENSGLTTLFMPCD